MRYRTLGKTGIKVSVVGVGTWQFGGEWGKEFTQDEVDAMFVRARELGINLVDTAECYGDHVSERLVGTALEKDREDWVIATKFGHKFQGHMKRSTHWEPDEVVEQLEESLEALRTDYVDLYQFHSGPDEAFDNPALWEELRRQQEKGKIRHLGISISSSYKTAHQIEKATDVGAEAAQVLYNRLERRPEKDVLPSCREQNLGVLTRVPLASGFLTGKYQPGDEQAFPPNDVRSGKDEEKQRKMLEEAQRIREQEVPEGVNMAQYALAWCLKHPAVSCVIPGCKSVEQVESNAGAADLDMVRDDHPHAI